MKIFFSKILIIISSIILSAISNTALSLSFSQKSWFKEKAFSYLDSQGHPVNANVIMVNSKEVKIRILSVPLEVKKTLGSSEVSLRLLARSFLFHPKYKDKDWILVNGGFSSYQFDIPLGLLIVDEKVYSRIEKRDIKYTFNGILCQRKDNASWEILKANNYSSGLCKQALQSGPILVTSDNKVDINLNEPEAKEPYIRTAICLMDDSSIKLISTSEKINLLPLAQWLHKAEKNGGLGCKSALNLSGDSSSGIVMKSRKNLKTLGEGTFPIPTALIIEP